MDLANPQARAKGMPIRFRAAAGAGLVALVAAAAFGQGSGSTGLALRVHPEALVAPSSAVVLFDLTRAGDTVMGAPVAVTGWMRALPNRQIRMTAGALELSGPSGAAPVSAIHWSGAMLRTEGGGVAASCAGGTFGDGSPQLLVTGWTVSGVVTCNVTFSLVTDASWETGAYRAEISLGLLAQ